MVICSQCFLSAFFAGNSFLIQDNDICFCHFFLSVLLIEQPRFIISFDYLYEKAFRCNAYVVWTFFLSSKLNWINSILMWEKKKQIYVRNMSKIFGVAHKNYVRFIWIWCEYFSLYWFSGHNPFDFLYNLYYLTVNSYIYAIFLVCTFLFTKEYIFNNINSHTYCSK